MAFRVARRQARAYQRALKIFNVGSDGAFGQGWSEVVYRVRKKAGGGTPMFHEGVTPETGGAHAVVTPGS